MLIPVRCFTCNKVIGDKYLLYLKISGDIIKEKGINPDEIRYMDTTKQQDYSPYGEAMNKLGLTKMCCRRHMLGHVDIIDEL